MSFFNEAFGADEDGFQKILIMPEALIIHRMKYKENVTADWWLKWSALSKKQKEAAKKIIFANVFTNTVVEAVDDNDTREVLRYYQIRREK